MTARRETELTCDGPDLQPDRCNTLAIFHHTAEKARAEARADGWLTGLPGGRDQCPRCRPDAGGQEQAA